MEEKCDKPRQVCHDKDFNVVTNSSASDKDQTRKYVATKKKSVATTTTCNCEKLCGNKRKYFRDKGREEPRKHVAT